jgi:hypothetical protein
MISLDSITFDITGFILHGDHNGVRVWRTSLGDGFGLFYSPQPPDSKLHSNSIDEVRTFYRNEARADGGAILEVDILKLDDCKVIRTIIKTPQKPNGMTYWGTLTLPFRNFSYVLKVQCREIGTTGMRDSFIFSAHLKSGEVTLGKDGQILGWMQDPYDPSATGPLAKNKSESEEYDIQFPKHPLSRLRQTLAHLQPTLKVSEEVKREL